MTRLLEGWTTLEAPTLSWGSRGRYLATLGAVAVVYLGAAKFGFTLAFATKQVTAVWPPTGIAVVAIFLCGYRVWPGVALGALLANAMSGESLATAGGIAFGNTVGPLFGAFLLRRLGVDGRLVRVRDSFILVAVGMASMTVTATNGVANLALGGVIPWSAYRSVWWVWWAGDALGVIVVAPLLLVWALGERSRLSGRQIAELATLSVMLLSLSYVAFFGALLPPNSRIEYAVFSLIIWSALRFGPRAATTVVFAISGFAIWSAIHDRGPFATGTLDQRLVLLDVFLAMVTLTALALAAVTAERRRAEHGLRQAHNQLELRVEERTAELAKANINLVRDQARLEEAQQMLTHQTAELERSNVELERFAYAASHDLRAPLRAITQLADWISEDEQNRLSDESKTHVGILQSRIRRMESLLVDLLEYSRVGRTEPVIEVVDVGELLAEVAETAHRRPGFSVEVTGPTPVLMTCRLPLKRVFMNLLDNAIKHHDRPEGLIRVTATSTERLIRFTVADDGPGIPTEHRERVFEMFQTLKPRDQVEGSGMGLSLVRKIVEMAGGEIALEGGGGRGASFCFTWPLNWKGAGIESRSHYGGVEGNT